MKSMDQFYGQNMYNQFDTILRKSTKAFEEFDQ